MITMRSTPALVLVALLLSGCTGSRGAPPKSPSAATTPSADEPSEPGPPERPEPSLSSYAVIPVGTALRLAPDASAPATTVPAVPSHQSDGPLPAPARGAVVQIVGVEGEFLAVELVGADQQHSHCAPTLPAAESFRLRFYVARDAPLLVLKRQLEISGLDRTTAWIAPGVPLRAQSSGVAVLDARGVRIKVAIPEDARGYDYVPSTTSTKRARPERVPGVAALLFDGVSLQGAEHLAGGRKPQVFGYVKDGSGHLVTVASRCLILNVRSSHAPQPVEQGMFGIFEAAMDPSSGRYLASSAPRTEPWFEVEAGTSIYWPDGRPAGEVLAAHSFEQEPRLEGERGCFALSLGEQAQALSLCFAMGTVRKVEPPKVAAGSGSPRQRLSERRTTPVPIVRQAKHIVEGSLDRDIIRRIVRAHINELRYCYNLGLNHDPKLSGRVKVRFVIDAAGKVSSSEVVGNTIADEGVSRCVAKATTRWKFPRPPGGTVTTVTYPFIFKPGDSR